MHSGVWLFGFLKTGKHFAKRTLPREKKTDRVGDPRGVCLCALHALCSRSAPSLHPAPGSGRAAMLVLCATAKDSFRKPATGAWDHLADEANGGVRPQLSESFYVSTRRPM